MKRAENLDLVVALSMITGLGISGLVRLLMELPAAIAALFNVL